MGMGVQAFGTSSVGSRRVAERPPTPFFQYSARLGRYILLAQRQASPVAAEHWRRQGISAEFLTAFWQRLWSSRQPGRAVTFQWLGLPTAQVVVTHRRHRVIASGTALWHNRYGDGSWRLYSYRGDEHIFTWGAVAWSTLSGPALGYETTADSLAL